MRVMGRNIHISSFLNRHVIFYILVFFIMAAMADLREISKNVNLAVLNRFRPPGFADLVALAKSGNVSDSDVLSNYQRYYAAVRRVMPELSEAHALYGFCTYYLGDRVGARRAYQHSLELNPHVFSYHYNAGQLAWQAGEFLKAGEFFQKALATSPELNLQFIMRSQRLFLPLAALLDPESPQRALGKYFRDHYRLAGARLVASRYRAGDFLASLQAAGGLIKTGFEDGELYFYAGASAYELGGWKQAVVFLWKGFEYGKRDAWAVDLMIQIFRDIQTRVQSTELETQIIILEKMSPREATDSRETKLMLF